MTIDAALREAAGGTGKLVLVTVAEVTGSAPRHSGSRMAIRPDGVSIGSVGGGKPEARALEEARSCLERGRSSSITVEMTGAEATGAELICGGVAEIWVEFASDRSLYAAAVAAVDGDEPVVLASSAAEGCVAAIGAGGRIVAGRVGSFDAVAVSRARESGVSRRGGADGLLYSPVEPADRLLILGGGHVGQAIARAAASLSFRTTVVDPRPEFSAPSRFPAGVQCLTSVYAEAIEGFRFGPGPTRSSSVPGT